MGDVNTDNQDSTNTDDLNGLQIMQQNMEALENDDDLPFEDDESVIEENLEEEEPLEEELEEELDEIAVKDGYITKEDWVAKGNAPEDYMTAEEFAKVGKMRDSKDITRQQLAKRFVQMESTMNEMMKNQSSMLTEARESEREKVIAELKSQQDEAIELGDTDKALKLERDINEKQKVEEKPVEQQLDASIQEWFDSNQYWYNADPAAAGLLNAQLAKAEQQGIKFEDAIIDAEAKVKAHFPYHFDEEPAGKKPEASAKPKPRPRGAVESSRRPASQKAKTKSFADLDPAMRGIAQKAAKASGLSEAEYMEQIS